MLSCPVVTSPLLLPDAATAAPCRSGPTQCADYSSGNDTPHSGQMNSRPRRRN
jgi:hypothetical protein